METMDIDVEGPTDIDVADAPAEVQPAPTDEEYEVECILDEKTIREKPTKKGKKSKSTLMYLVKWKGYTETTWEPAANLDCDELLNAYRAQKQEQKAAEKAEQERVSEERRSTRKRRYAEEDVTPEATTSRHEQREVRFRGTHKGQDLGRSSQQMPAPRVGLSVNPTGTSTVRQRARIEESRVDQNNFEMHFPPAKPVAIQGSIEDCSLSEDGKSINIQYKMDKNEKEYKLLFQLSQDECEVLKCAIDSLATIGSSSQSAFSAEELKRMEERQEKRLSQAMNENAPGVPDDVEREEPIDLDMVDSKQHSIQSNGDCIRNDQSDEFVEMD